MTPGATAPRTTNPTTKARARRAAARPLQAYHEWMPIACTGADPLQIYRSFDFGDLLALHMLDTRVVARDQQLDYADYFTATGIDAAAFAAAVANPDRQLLGAAQTAWLQTPAARLDRDLAGAWPAGADGPHEHSGADPGRGQQPGQRRHGVAVRADRADRADQPGRAHAAQQAILAQPSIPYNLDAWDGYAAARETRARHRPRARQEPGRAGRRHAQRLGQRPARHRRQQGRRRVCDLLGQLARLRGVLAEREPGGVGRRR